jgi:uncharacterized repeat protein (TIGR03843 family)
MAGTELWHPEFPEEIRELLTHGEITSCEHIPWGSNYTFCVALEIEGQSTLGVYKPRRGERPLWDFPDGTLYCREYAAFVVSQAVGWPFIPPTVIRDGPHGIGTVQLYVESEPPGSMRELQRPDDLDLARIAAFDIFTNNADRKAGHLLRDRSGAIWGIDHGLCFNVPPKVRTVLLHFCGEPLPQAVRDELSAFRSDAARVEGLTTILESVLDPEEVVLLFTRIDRMIESGEYPTLGGYRNVPWPPF